MSFRIFTLINNVKHYIAPVGSIQCDFPRRISNLLLTTEIRYANTYSIIDGKFLFVLGLVRRAVTFFKNTSCGQNTTIDYFVMVSNEDIVPEYALSFLDTGKGILISSVKNQTLGLIFLPNVLGNVTPNGPGLLFFFEPIEPSGGTGIIINGELENTCGY